MASVRRLKRLFIPFNSSTALVQWGSFFTGLAGMAVGYVFAWWVLSQTGSVAQFGTIVSVTSIARTLTQLFSGALGDRFGTITIMQWAANAQWLLLIILAGLMIDHRYVFVLALIINALLAVANGIVSGMSNPGLVEVAPEEKLPEVMAQRGSLVSMAKLIAPSTAAILLGIMNGIGAMVVALIISILGGGLLSRIPAMDRANHSNSVDMPSTMRIKRTLFFIRDWCTDTLAGVRAYSHIHVDFLVNLVCSGINLGLPAYFAVLVPYYVLHVYALSPRYLGIFDVFFCLGMLCGGRITIRWLNNWVGKLNAIMVSIGVLTLMVIATAWVHDAILFATIQCVGGAFMLSFFTNVVSLRALATPKEYRARIMSAANFMASLSSGPGIALCTWITHEYGGEAGIYSMAGIIVFSTICLYFIPNARLLLNMPEEQVRDAYLTHYPRAFNK